MSVGLNPLDDRVAIRPDPVPDQSKGGIHIPQSAKDKPSVGTVVAVGPGRADERGGRVPLQVAVGDRVFYGKFAGHDVEQDGQTFRMVRETEVLLRLGN